MSDTTPETAQAATQPDVLDLSETTLIGTIIGTDAPIALFRSGRGRIVTVHAGERIGRAQVTAILEGRVVLNQNGNSVEMSLPAAS